MVKKIILLMAFLLIFSFVNAQEIDTYDYNYIANNVSINLLAQYDTDNSTVLKYNIKTSPGEHEISAVLGSKSIEKTLLFDDYTNNFTLTFNKMTSGNQSYLLIINREDSLIVFLNNETLLVDNNVTFDAELDSIIVDNESFEITMNVDTNLNIENSSLKIISENKVIYQSINSTLNDKKIIYSFKPYENAEFFLYQIEINGYTKDLIDNLGAYNFSLVKGFTDTKINKGLKISFNSTNDKKDITVFSDENEFVYKIKTINNTFTIPNDIIASSMINGPYKVVININDSDYEFMTKPYVYGDFVVLTQGTINNTNEIILDNKEGNNAGSTININNSNDSKEDEEIILDDTQEVVLNESEVIQDKKVDKSPKQSVVQKVSDTISNFITGFSTKNLSSNKNILELGIGFIVLILIMGYFYIKQRKDTYLYDM